MTGFRTFKQAKRAPAQAMSPVIDPAPDCELIRRPLKQVARIAPLLGVPNIPPPVVKPAVNCTPPYYYDEKGNRVFKKECPL